MWLDCVLPFCTGLQVQLGDKLLFVLLTSPFPLTSGCTYCRCCCCCCCCCCCSRATLSVIAAFEKSADDPDDDDAGSDPTRAACQWP